MKKITTDTLIYGLGPQVPKLASIFVLPLVTPFLTKTDFGVYGVLMAYTGALGAFNYLGMRLTIVNAFYHHSNRYLWIWRQVYGFLRIWNVVFALLNAMLVYWVLPEEANDQIWVILAIMVGSSTLFGPTQMINNTYYQVKRKPIQVAWRATVFGLLTIGLNYYFIAHLQMGFMGWIWSNFISSVLNNATHWYHLNFVLGCKPIMRFKKYRILKSLKVALPVIPHYYSGYLLNSSDRVVMDFYKVPISQIGLYNVAYIFGGYVNNGLMALSQALGPQLAELYKKQDFLSARTLVWTLQFLLLTVCFLLALWSKEIFSILYRNEEFSEAYKMSVIIIMAYSYRPMYQGANSILFYQEETKKLWRLSFMAGIINVGLNLIAIPLYGIYGAAIVTFISYLYMGYAGYFFKEFSKSNPFNYKPIFWLLTTILLSALLYLLLDVGFYIKTLISVIVLMMTIIYLYQRRKILAKF